jgi:hypothetical protein
MSSQDARQAAPLEEIVVAVATSQQQQDRDGVAHRRHVDDGALAKPPDCHMKAVCAPVSLSSVGSRAHAVGTWLQNLACYY